MKAIINIKNKHSQYHKFNGLTFEVVDLLSTSVGLIGLTPNNPFNQTDFSFDEIIIVDIKNEIIKGFVEHNDEVVNKLRAYLRLNNIKLPLLWTTYK